MTARKRKRQNDQHQGTVAVADAAAVSPSTTTATAHAAEPLAHHRLLLPAVEAAFTLSQFAGQKSNPDDFQQLIAAFASQAIALQRGSLVDAERMLMAQATTLDVIFNQLARRAAANLDGQYLRACDTLLRLAFKAQSQSRATLETLAFIKNPRSVAFVRQANIANGPQQVNNGTSPTSRARETESPPIELLEQHHEERLDTSTPQAAIRTDSAMATVEEVHRATDSER
jgi:hypothetical protein